MRADGPSTCIAKGGFPSGVGRGTEPSSWAAGSWGVAAGTLSHGGHRENCSWCLGDSIGGGGRTWH